jgi:hypothetical protein
MGDDRPNMRLVHGFVTGTGGGIEGVRYPHAWLEYDVPLPDEWADKGMQPIRMAMDLTTDERLKEPLELPADLYRSFGQAVVLAEYTEDEARKLAVEKGHWGPWMNRAENILAFRRANMHGTLTGPNADPDYQEKYHPGSGGQKSLPIEERIRKALEEANKFDQQYSHSMILAWDEHHNLTNLDGYTSA